jgi:hypothetical protein
MRFAKCLTLISLLGLSLHRDSQAGIILLPGKIQDGIFKGTAEKERAFSIRYSTIHVDVLNGMAKAKIEETVIRESDVKETVGIIPLPIGISEAGIQSVLFGGQKVKSEFLNPEKAEQFFRSVATATGSVSILSYSGRPALVLEGLSPEEKTM